MSHEPWPWMLMAKVKGHVCWSPCKYSTYPKFFPFSSFFVYLTFRNGSMGWAEMMTLQKIHPPRACQSDRLLTWKRDFRRYNYVKDLWMTTSLTEWTLNPMIRLLIRKKEKSHIEAIWTLEWCAYKPRSTKKCQQPPESSREAGWKFFLRDSLQRTSSAHSLILDFWP